MSASLPASRPVLILHTGDPIDALKTGYGTYAAMLQQAAGLDEAEIVSVFQGQQPQAPDNYRAVLITGSPAMVTDKEPWSETCAAWLRGAVQAQVPMFGICYGHQLMAHALGGEVGNNPAGREVGTQAIRLADDAKDDPLAAGLPNQFAAQTMHLQSVLRLPAGARALAASDKDACQMVCWGPGRYSTQFHPEFNADFVRAHLQHYAGPYAKEAIDALALAGTVTATPEAGLLVRRFLAAFAPTPR